MRVRSKAGPVGALLGGDRHAEAIEGWLVAWESHGQHRLWCHQARGVPAHLVCIVMFNPGSLSGSGERLASDDTLRIIRRSMPDRTAALILNLFTLAAPDLDDFFKPRAKRLHPSFSLAPFRSMPIDAVVYAYGDIGQDQQHNQKFGKQVRERIAEMSEALSAFRTVQTPKAFITARKNPKHPKHWKLLGQIPTMQDAIRSCLG